jgi:hypothetical protein
MMRFLFKRWIDLGKAEMLSQVIAKFEELHDEYFHQGEHAAANLVVDLVAYLQDDEDGQSDKGV